MKRLFILLLLLCLVGCTTAPPEEPTVTPPVEVSVTPYPASGDLNYTPTIRADYDGENIRFTCEEPLTELFLFQVEHYVDSEDEIHFSSYGFGQYWQSLSPGEAIELVQMIPEGIPNAQLLYTNATGAQEAVLLGYNGRDGGAALLPSEPLLRDGSLVMLVEELSQTPTRLGRWIFTYDEEQNDFLLTDYAFSTEGTRLFGEYDRVPSEFLPQLSLRDFSPNPIIMPDKLSATLQKLSLQFGESEVTLLLQRDEGSIEYVYLFIDETLTDTIRYYLSYMEGPFSLEEINGGFHFAHTDYLWDETLPGFREVPNQVLRTGSPALTLDYELYTPPRSARASYTASFTPTEPLHHVTVFGVTPVYDSDSTSYISGEFFQYIPTLNVGEEISIDMSHDDSNLALAYETKDGEIHFAIVVQHGDELQLAIPELSLGETGYDNGYDLSIAINYGEDGYPLLPYLKSGALAVPPTMRVVGGDVGDVNADGLPDAVVCLDTNISHSVMRSSSALLAVYLGQPDGSFTLTALNNTALFMPYRSSCGVVAGEGYLDIQYSLVGGALPHHTEVDRFSYDSEQDGWFLTEFCHQHDFGSFNGVGIDTKPEPIAAPPGLYGTPLTDFSRYGMESAYFQEDYYDATGDFWGMTIGVRINEATGYLEGVIHRKYDVATIRAPYDPNSAFPLLEVDEANDRFFMQGEEIQYDRDFTEEFFKAHYDG